MHHHSSWRKERKSYHHKKWWFYVERPNNIRGANTKCEGSLNDVAIGPMFFPLNKGRLYHWHLQYFCRQDSLETGQNPQCYCNSSSSYGRLLLLLLCVWWLRTYQRCQCDLSVCLLVPSIHSRTCVHGLLLLFYLFIYFGAGGVQFCDVAKSGADS